MIRQSSQELNNFIRMFESQRPGRIEFLFKLPKRGKVAEIGVAEGSFSECILKINDPKELHLIDCWEHQNWSYRSDWCNAPQKEQDKRFKSVTEKFEKYPQVIIHKGYSLEVVKIFPDHYFDWIYIDSNHTYKAVKKDLEAWFPKIRSNGIIAGHDYTCKPYFPMGVIQAVDEFIEKHDIEMFLIDDDPWHSWAIRRKGKRDIGEIKDYLNVQITRNLARSKQYERIYNLYLIFKDKVKKLNWDKILIKLDQKSP